MTEIDLLDVVQPADGWFAILGIKGAKVRQELVQTREEVDKITEKFLKEKRDVYFGVAKYKTDASRTKDNVKSLKALWVDIDCGEAKAVPNETTGRPDGYVDQTAGIAALKSFCELVGLPRPLLVDSGRGIHAYWILTKELSREEWEPIADRLKDLCLKHEFYVDPAVFEAARVLRIPDTLNFKDTPPNKVVVLSKVLPQEVAPEELSDLLGVKPKKETPDWQNNKREMSALGKDLANNIQSSFSKIMKGGGCNQLLECYLDQATMGYDQWCAVLSVVGKCEDRDTAIPKMCSKYPDYDEAKCFKKAASFDGVHTCEAFEKHNPGGCDGCPSRGAIKNPLALGKEYLRATEDDNEVEVADLEGNTEVHKIPEYPFPFYRGKNGGVYQQMKEEEKDDIHVYEHDLYVDKRMHDPEHGDVVIMKLHTPRDGVKEFIVPNTSIMDTGKLRECLAKHGVICKPKIFPKLMDFIILSVKELQLKKRADLMRLQFGWADKNSKFILGDREITPEGTYYSPPSSITEDMAPKLQPEGSYEVWKEVFGTYGMKGHEPHAFAAATAFGAPLLKFLGQKGAIINVIHPNSGTGKTTILHMCNSVYGHPDELCFTFEDTIASTITAMGILNNLPFTIDEITSMKVEDFSHIIYCSSQGKGRNRMEAATNKLRTNRTTWQTITLTSANASFGEKLGVYKNSPDGELMRLLEYKIEEAGVLSEEEGKQLYDQKLQHNYGHAGEEYTTWLVNNLEKAKKNLLDTQAYLDKELKLTQRERFWSAVISANLTGIMIANRLGITQYVNEEGETVKWDVARITEWAKNMIMEMRKDVAPPASNTTEVVGDYIHRHYHNMLGVNDKTDLRTNMKSLPVMTPKGELLIRYEPDTKLLFLTAKHFREDCVKLQINYKETLRGLSLKGAYLGAVNKRLAKGMDIPSPAVRCLMFNYAAPDFVDMDALTPPPESEENAS